MISKEGNSVGRKLLSGSVLRISNLVATAATSFFLMPFIVHHLGDRTYGFWSLATAFIGYYNLLDLGLSSAVSQYMCTAIGRKDDFECRAVFNTALRLQLLVGSGALLITCALAAATPWICKNPADTHLFWKVIVILGVNAALGFPARVYWAVLEAELRFDIQSLLANMSLVVRTVLILWAVIAGGGLLALAWAALIATLPVTALQIWLARKQASWARIDNRFVQAKRVGSFFSYSFYSFLAYIADIVRFQLDPLVISGLIGLSAVTHYKVAGVLAQYYLQIIVVTVGMLLPVLSRLHGAGDHAALEDVFFFGTKISCCISIFICFALVGWGRPFITCWMGNRYEDGYIPLILLSLSVLLEVSQKPSADLLFATFKHRFYAGINCVEAVLNLAFSLALARPFGILGVAMGTFIGAFLIRALVQPWWVCRVGKINLTAYIKSLCNNFIRCGLVAVVAVAVVAWGIRENYFWLAGSAICASGIYGVGAWFVVFDKDERARLLRTLRKTEKPQQSEFAIIGEAVR